MNWRPETESETGRRTESGQPPILQVAQIVTTLARGGAQATVMASVDMAEHDVSVTVLAGPDVTDEGSFWDDQTGDRSRVVLVPPMVRRLSPAKDLQTLFWLFRWLRTNRPDVVHTHSSKAGVLGRLAAKAAGIRCAHTIHGWGPLYSSRQWVRFAAIAVERALATLTAALVVVGRHDLYRGLSARIGTVGQYRVIRSGVDTSLASAAAAERDVIRTELGVSDRFVVGMVARMAFPKDHANLVAAFRKADIPGSILLLIGDGPQRNEVERLVAKAGITDRVKVLGLRSDAARVVAAFDVAMLSSRWEGMPRSVVEAAAACVPVVATDVGSVSDLIEDGVSGRLVPAGDVHSMAAALRDVHADAPAYRAMADVAAVRSKEFSVDRMRRELAALWADMADRSATQHEADKSGEEANEAGVPERQRRRSRQRRQQDTTSSRSV